MRHNCRNHSGFRARQLLSKESKNNNKLLLLSVRLSLESLLPIIDLSNGPTLAALNLSSVFFSRIEFIEMGNLSGSPVQKVNLKG